ncbi:hypothetical protein REPUB_Repub06bG0111700 [Reevesia pubescens]
MMKKGEEKVKGKENTKLLVEDEDLGDKENEGYASDDNFQTALSKYAARTHRNIYCYKKDHSRVRAKCVDSCPWNISASYDGSSANFMVKTYTPRHRCNKIFELRMVTTKFLADKYRDKITDRPRIKLDELRKDIESTCRLYVELDKLGRAKKIVIVELENRIKEEYNQLWDYAKELRRANPRSTIKMKAYHRARWLFLERIG